jgi:hypothetical protein
VLLIADYAYISLAILITFWSKDIGCHRRVNDGEMQRIINADNAFLDYEILLIAPKQRYIGTYDVDELILAFSLKCTDKLIHYALLKPCGTVTNSANYRKENNLALGTPVHGEDI